jgi:hypothetical protein
MSADAKTSKPSPVIHYDPIGNEPENVFSQSRFVVGSSCYIEIGTIVQLGSNPPIRIVRVATAEDRVEYPGPTYDHQERHYYLAEVAD